MERKIFRFLLDHFDRHVARGARPAKARFSHRQVVAVWLWAVLHDRPVSWAVQAAHWPAHDRCRPLPSNATMSRRLRDPALLQALEGWLQRVADAQARDPARTLIVDGKALTVAEHTADRDARKGRAQGRFGTGYKLHAIVDSLGVLRAFRVTPLNAGEATVAREMVDAMPVQTPRRMLADAVFDSNKLYEAAGRRGVQLLAKRRYPHAQALGRHRHSVWRLRAIEMMHRTPTLLNGRDRIETFFSTLGGFAGGLGPLPQHVRRLHRVHRWVLGKLLIYTAYRSLRTQRLKAA